MRRPGEIADQLALFPEAFEPRHTPLAIRLPEPGLPPPPDSEAIEAPADRSSLEDALQRVVPGTNVAIHYTENRSIILSLRPSREGAFVLRAHRCFRVAPALVAEAAVRLYLTRSSPKERRRLSGIVTLWHQDQAEPPESLPPETLRPGVHHDLRALMIRVNRDWFDSALDLDVTFGDRIARRLMGRHERRRPRSIVVINPVLDHPWITSWYLDYLMYHECLHEVVPPARDGRRLLLHPPEFKERERRHPACDRAKAYERWVMGSAWPTLRAAAQEAIHMESPRITTKSSTSSARRK